jgi:hypothetical protein
MSEHVEIIHQIIYERERKRERERRDHANIPLKGLKGI